MVSSDELLIMFVFICLGEGGGGTMFVCQICGVVFSIELCVLDYGGSY